MNSKYIKRQLTLNEIGIPINKELEESYNAFKELFGELVELDNGGTIIRRWYDKNGKYISYHFSEPKIFTVEEDLYWLFVFDTKQYYYDIQVKMLIAFFEYQLKIDIKFLKRGHISS